jgi:biotin carboxyl carrier protein
MPKPMIRINGKPAEPASLADLIEVEPGVYTAILDGQSYELTVSDSEVEIEGVRFEVEIEDPRKWNPADGGLSAHGREAVKAPMPGKVIRILVKEGEVIAARQGVVVVEAMKMQNELKSPRAGRVATIAVKENQAVNAGSVLITIE